MSAVIHFGDGTKAPGASDRHLPHLPCAGHLRRVRHGTDGGGKSAPSTPQTVVVSLPQTPMPAAAASGRRPEGGPSDGHPPCRRWQRLPEEHHRRARDGGRVPSDGVQPVSHTYTALGHFGPDVTVAVDDGSRDSDARDLFVLGPPEVTLRVGSASAAVQTGGSYSFGGRPVVSFSATVTNPFPAASTSASIDAGIGYDCHSYKDLGGGAAQIQTFGVTKTASFGGSGTLNIDTLNPYPNPIPPNPTVGVLYTDCKFIDGTVSASGSVSMTGIKTPTVTSRQRPRPSDLACSAAQPERLIIASVRTTPAPERRSGRP